MLVRSRRYCQLLCLVKILGDRGFEIRTFDPQRGREALGSWKVRESLGVRRVTAVSDRTLVWRGLDPVRE